MKNISIKAVLLALLVICITFQSVSLAEELPILMREQVENNDIAIQSMAELNGTLYILTRSILLDGGLLRWRANEEAPVNLPVTRTDIGASLSDGQGGIRRPTCDVLLSDGEQLYALYTQDGSVYAVHEEGDSVYYEPIATLNLGASASVPDSVCMAGSAIVALSENASGKALWVYDLETGHGRELPVKHVQSMAAYKDNLLFLLMQDMNNSWDVAAQRAIPPTLGVYDMAKNEMIREMPLPAELNVPFGMAYNQTDNGLYLLGTSLIYRMDVQGTFQKCGYVVGSLAALPTAPILLLSGNLSAVATSVGIRVSGTDAAMFESLRQISVAGVDMFFPGALLTQAKIREPGIVVNVDYNRFDSRDAMVSSLITRADDTDVFMLDSSDLLTRTMLDKGYVLDLSANPLLSEAVKKMHPAIAAQLASDGKVYGMPYELSIRYPFAAKPRLFEKLNLPVPTTLFELCDFITSWNEGPLAAHGDYLPMEGDNYQTMLYRMGLGLYVSYMDQRGENLSFDTPLFRAMMEKIASVQTDHIEGLLDPHQGQIPLVTYGMAYNLETEKEISEQLKYGYDAFEVPLLLGINAEAPLRPEGSVAFLCINAGGGHGESAVAFLEAVAQSLTLKDLIALMPGETGPVPNRLYEKNMQDYADAIEETQKQLGQADEAQKKDLEEMLQIFEANAADYRENYRYDITLEQIAQFRSRLDDLFLTNGSALRDAAELDYMLEGIIEGRLDVEAFIKEADAKLRQIYSEMR